MGMPGQMYPVATMAEEQLERMYPRVYHIIYPEVIQCCDTIDMTCGFFNVPSCEEVERMVEDICTRKEKDVELALKQECRETGEERQLALGGRRLFRNLVTILLIRELIRRRRRPFFGFPSFGGFRPHNSYYY